MITIPLPKPKAKETKDEWMERCMDDNKMKKEFPDNKQRLGVCYSQWNKVNEVNEMSEKKEKKEDKEMFGDIDNPEYVEDINDIEDFKKAFYGSEEGEEDNKDQ